MRRHLLLLGLFALPLTAGPASAAELKILLPLGRTAYQTNEWIDVSVVRTAPQALAAGTLTLKLAGSDGGGFTAEFPAAAVPVRGQGAAATEHLHLSGWLLRPGKYALEVACDGATAKAGFELCSNERKSSFRLINWGRAKGAEQLVQGEDGFGFNLFYGHYGSDEEANFVRAGVDFMSNCTMGGGHQMDLRFECDWSDPYVTRAGTMRVTRRALTDRTRPNVPGVHFYDEPGLTWDKNDATGEFTPHGIKSQIRSYVSAFGGPPPEYHKLDPKDPVQAAKWKHWATWKLGFMDAAWREAQFGVSQVRSDYLSVTQSQYGWSAFVDGYYFNVVRSLPVTSGHGGYHDFGPGFFNPSYFLEIARARDFAKPCWYLPTWYGNTTGDQFRLEQNLSFQTNVLGMMSPPDLEPATNASARQGIVESNQLMRRLGPVFTTMPVTRPPVAMLYSLSQAIHTQTQDRGKNYAHAMPQGANLPLTYLAGKLLQTQFLAVVDEDVLDGTLAADHKAVVLTSVDYLDPTVVAALEDFAKNGGLVLLTGDSTVAIKGAVKLSAKAQFPDQAKIDELLKANKAGELGPLTTMAKYLEGAAVLAKAIKPELDKAGIKPFVETDLPSLVVTRQAAGDVEYLLVVNATPDYAAKEKNTPKAVEGTITLPKDGRAVYDAVRGGPVAEFAGGATAGKFRFGPGQMRVFARTARPIARVRLATPTVVRELVREKDPIRLSLGAAVVGTGHQLLSGSFPLHVRVISPLGEVRHELYRATAEGVWSATLPLAANDPQGKWTVVVRDLLAGTEDTQSFDYAPPPRARSLAGTTPRAVFAANDRDNVFRFARLFHDVTIVKGKSPFNDAAAKRLAEVLKPWGVRCKEVALDEASKSRTITGDEARTWAGLAYAAKGQVKPGAGNPPNVAGFAAQGPVVLLGNPDDHPIIKFLLAERFLAYAPAADLFPGRGRGMVAWQRDGVGRGQESVALIAYDEEGMAEAVGSFYEAVAGIDPLTRWNLPKADTLTPAKSANVPKSAEVVWAAVLPDRVVSLQPADGGLRAATHDGSWATLDAAGKVTGRGVLKPDEIEAARKPAPPADKVAKEQARPDRMLKLAAVGGDRAGVAYWGGTLRIVDGKGVVLSEQQLPQDVTALAWSGDTLVAGLADGRVMALRAK